MAVTLQKLLNEGIEQLRKSSVPEPELDGKYLLMEAFGLSASDLLLKQGQEIAAGEDELYAAGRFQGMIERRCGRIPLQYILGTQNFMGLEFRVDKRVLIPRPDTEDLVELVLKEQPDKDKRVLDMCTGSGCIAISLAVLGGYRQVTAVDVSDGALEVARGNAERLQVSDRVRVVKSSMFEQEDVIKGAKGEPYHIIVSNPPYIPTNVITGLQSEVKDFEPVMALDGKEDGLYFYRILAAESSRLLVSGGYLYLEIGYDQGDPVRELLHESGYTEIEVIKDTPGLDRIVKARYVGGFHV